MGRDIKLKKIRQRTETPGDATQGNDEQMLPTVIEDSRPTKE